MKFIYVFEVQARFFFQKSVFVHESMFLIPSVFLCWCVCFMFSLSEFVFISCVHACVRDSVRVRVFASQLLCACVHESVRCARACFQESVRATCVHRPRPCARVSLIPSVCVFIDWSVRVRVSSRFRPCACVFISLLLFVCVHASVFVRACS